MDFALSPYLYAISEECAFLPACILAMLPLIDLIGMEAHKVCCAVGVVLAVAVLGGVLCASLGIFSTVFMLPLAFVYLLVYKRFSRLDWPRTLFVVCSSLCVTAYVSYWAVIIDAYTLADTVSSLYLALPGMITQWALSAAFVIVLWRPCRTYLPRMLMSVGFRREHSVIWSITWVLPAYIAGLLVYAVPVDTSILSAGRLFSVVIVLLISAFFLLAVYYATLWHLMSAAEQTIESREQVHQRRLKQFYDEHMNERIREASRLNHDARQFVHVLEGFASEGDLEGFRQYVAGVRDYAPDAPIRYSANPVVNAAVLYFCDEAIRMGVRPDVDIDIPESVPFDDAGLSSLVGNLLENAVDALAEQVHDGADPRRLRLSVRGSYQPPSPFVFAVDNTTASCPVRLPDGMFVSTKHDGAGIGIESVENVASHYRGNVRIECRDSLFCASAMLLAPEKGSGPELVPVRKKEDQQQ